MLKPGYGMIVNETMVMIIMANIQSCFLSSIHQILAGIRITERMRHEARKKPHPKKNGLPRFFPFCPDSLQLSLSNENNPQAFSHGAENNRQPRLSIC